MGVGWCVEAVRALRLSSHRSACAGSAKEKGFGDRVREDVRRDHTLRSAESGSKTLIGSVMRGRHVPITSCYCRVTVSGMVFIFEWNCLFVRR